MRKVILLLFAAILFTTAKAADTVFYYTFDETLANSAGTAPNLTLPGTDSSFFKFVPGMHGGAIEFNISIDSMKQYLMVDKSGLLDPGVESYTVCAWVKNTSALDHPSEHIILHQTNVGTTDVGAGATRYLLSTVTSGDDLAISTFISGRNSNSTAPIYRNTWTHMAIVANPADSTFTFYKNGKLSNVEKSPKKFETSSRGFMIGRHKNGPDKDWEGMVDDLILFKGMLTEAEIQNAAGIVPTYYAQVNSIVTTSAQSGMNPENLINYSGMDTIGDDLVHDWDYGKMFASAAQVRAMKIFMNLADTINLYSMQLFNHSHFWPEGNGGAGSYFTNRGMKDFKVYYAATDNMRMDTVPLTDPKWTLVNSFTLSRALDQQWNKGDKFLLGDIEANWIVIDGLNAHGGNKIGLDEIILWSREQTPIVAKSLKVNLEKSQVYNGEKIKAMATISPVNVSSSVAWEILEATAGTSIDASGLITAGDPGTVKVVASIDEKSDTVQLVINKRQVLLDFMNNQITYSSQDSAKSHGDLWLRDNPGDAGAIEIIAATEAPAGYNLTDSVLKVTINSTPLAWWQHGLMAETDTIVADTVNCRYMHVAVYVPGAVTMQGSNGLHKSWLKDDNKVKWVQKWNSNGLPGGGVTPAPGRWVDHVMDITNDTIHGKNIAHFEWYGYTTNAVSYVGSVVLTGDPAPRFVNTVAVSEITLSTDVEGNSVMETDSIQIKAAVAPMYASDKTVKWEIKNATEGSTISESGMLTAGKMGTITVVATANDGSGVSAEIDIVITQKPQVLLDFMKNQITYSSQDSVKSHGDLWLRDNPGDAGSLKIIPSIEAPAGYDLTDSVLQVVIGANPLQWWQHGLMAETDTITVDTVNFRYMHVAVFVPGPITMQGSNSLHKSWLKDDKGVQKWNSNGLVGGGVVPSPGKWVDHVMDITNDSIHGKKLAHFEWFGYTTSDTSYVGSVVLSNSAEPRFVNITLAEEVKLTSAVAGDSVREAQTIKINAQVLPAGTNNKVVSWEVVGATEGTSIDADGLLTAGAPGTVTVKATTTDGSNISGTISIKIFAKNTAIETARNLGVMVYPNPSNGKFYVMLPNLNEGSFKVFDATGRAVRSGLLNSENVIDLSGNKAGIYLLQLNVGNKSTVTRLMLK